MGKYLEMSWEGSGRLPGEIDPREEGPEDLPLDDLSSSAAATATAATAAAELFDQLRELGAAALQRLLR